MVLLSQQHQATNIIVDQVASYVHPVDDSGLSAKRRLIAKIKQDRGVQEACSWESEVANYLSYQPSSAENDNAMLFWRSHVTDYPQLHKLARFYLSISATSVPVEAMFSITGIMLNSKRSSMSPTVLNYCTFIHDNHSVLQTT